MDVLIYGADTIELRPDSTFRHSSQNVGVSAGPWTLAGTLFSMYDRRQDVNSFPVWDYGTLTGATLHLDAAGGFPARTYSR